MEALVSCNMTRHFLFDDEKTPTSMKARQAVVFPQRRLNILLLISLFFLIFLERSEAQSDNGDVHRLHPPALLRGSHSHQGMLLLGPLEDRISDEEEGEEETETDAETEEAIENQEEEEDTEGEGRDREGEGRDGEREGEEREEEIEEVIDGEEREIVVREGEGREGEREIEGEIEGEEEEEEETMQFNQVDEPKNVDAWIDAVMQLNEAWLIPKFKFSLFQAPASYLHDVEMSLETSHGQEAQTLERFKAFIENLQNIEDEGVREFFSMGASLSASSTSRHQALRFMRSKLTESGFYHLRFVKRLFKTPQSFLQLMHAFEKDVEAQREPRKLARKRLHLFMDLHQEMQSSALQALTTVHSFRSFPEDIYALQVRLKLLLQQGPFFRMAQILEKEAQSIRTDWNMDYVTKVSSFDMFTPSIVRNVTRLQDRLYNFFVVKQLMYEEEIKKLREFCQKEVNIHIRDHAVLQDVHAVYCDEVHGDRFALVKSPKSFQKEDHFRHIAALVVKVLPAGSLYWIVLEDMVGENEKRNQLPPKGVQNYERLGNAMAFVYSNVDTHPIVRLLNAIVQGIAQLVRALWNAITKKD